MASFEIARGSPPECVSFHDVLVACDAMDVETTRRGPSNLKPIGSMLTRWTQRTASLSEASVEYEEVPEQRLTGVADRVQLDGEPHPANAVISIVGSTDSEGEGRATAVSPQQVEPPILSRKRH